MAVVVQQQQQQQQQGGGYRDDVRSYARCKAQKYLSTGECNSYLEALAVSVEKANTRSYPVDRQGENLSIFKAIYDCKQQQQQSAVSLRLRSASEKVSFDASSVELQWLQQSDTDLVGYMRPRQEVLLKSTRGRWTFQAQSASVDKPIKLRGAYDLSAALQVQGSARKALLLHRIPLFKVHELENSFKHSTPLSDLHLVLQVTEEKLVRVVALKIVCYAHPDKHQVLFTNAWSFETLPQAGITLAPRSMPVAEIPVRAKAPHWARFMNHVAKSVGCGEKDWSLSVVLSGEKRINYNASSLVRVGQLTEVFTNYALVRHLHNTYKGQPLETLLHHPTLVSELLLRSGHKKTRDALVALYGDQGVPTLYELMLHSAGLPATPVSFERLDGASGSISSVLYERCFRSEQLFNVDSDSDHVLSESLLSVSCISRRASLPHHSLLGHAVVAACLPDRAMAIKEQCRSLGMTNTYVSSVQNEQRHLSLSTSESHFACSTGLVTSAEDMSSFMAEQWKASTTQEGLVSHPHLSRMLLPEVAVGGGVTKDLHSVCLSGCESIRIHLSRSALAGVASSKAEQQKEQKVALGVKYKFGAIPGNSNALFCFVPELHLQFTLTTKFNTELLFANSTCGKKQLYGGCCPNHGGKCNKEFFDLKSFIKHMVLSISHDAFGVAETGTSIEACLDRQLGTDYSPSPKVLSGHEQHLRFSQSLDFAPAPDSDAYHAFESRLVNDSLFNRKLVPLFPALHIGIGEVQQATAGASVSTNGSIVLDKRELEESIFKKITDTLPQISIGKMGADGLPPGKKEHLVAFDYVLRHEKIGLEYGLLWDDNQGVFRVAEQEYFRGKFCVSDSLRISITKRSETLDGMAVVQHRGYMYASVESVREVVSAYLSHLEQQSVEKRKALRLKQDAELMPWTLKQNQQQQPPSSGNSTTTTTTTTTSTLVLVPYEQLRIGAAMDGAPQKPQLIAASPLVPLAVGALGGLAVGAALSRPYYYGPGYYPPGYYPGYYPDYYPYRRLPRRPYRDWGYRDRSPRRDRSPPRHHHDGGHHRR